jgi:hypothetical protein
MSAMERNLSEENVDKLVTLVGRLEEVKDVRTLIPLLLAKQG